MTAPTFTTDWSASIVHWPDMLADLAGKSDLRFLEIGCFEGRTTLWLLDHVLTDPSSRVYVIDPFNARYTQRDVFDRNLAAHLKTRQAVVLEGRSGDVLRHRRPSFGPLDFVYVDGSHDAADVLADAVLVWPLVKPGGLVCFDDYVDLACPEEWQRPEIAVDAFVRCYGSLIGKHGRVGADQYLVVKR
jgi:predicted O-methyltransferase YrrM